MRERLDWVLWLISPSPVRPVSLSFLSEASGVPYGTARRWPRGHNISRDDAAEVARTLQAMGYWCDEKWLFDGSGPAPHKMLPGASVAQEMPTIPPGDILLPRQVLEWIMAGPTRDNRTERMAGTVARTVARAIHDALATDELSKTRKGQEAIAAALHDFASRLNAERMDMSGVLAVEKLLRDGIL